VAVTSGGRPAVGTPTATVAKQATTTHCCAGRSGHQGPDPARVPFRYWHHDRSGRQPLVQCDVLLQDRGARRAVPSRHSRSLPKTVLPMTSQAGQMATSGSWKRATARSDGSRHAAPSPTSHSQLPTAIMPVPQETLPAYQAALRVNLTATCGSQKATRSGASPCTRDGFDTVTG